MKSSLLSLLMIIGILSFGNAYSQDIAKTETIKVWGNCGMCEKKIEKAALKAGASTAEWSERTKNAQGFF